MFLKHKWEIDEDGLATDMYEMMEGLENQILGETNEFEKISGEEDVIKGRHSWFLWDSSSQKQLCNNINPMSLFS